MTKINNTTSKKILRKQAKARFRDKKNFFKKIKPEQQAKLAIEQEQLFFKALLKMKINEYIKSEIE